MKKSLSNISSIVRLEAQQTNSYSSSQPANLRSHENVNDELVCGELCVRRSSLLSIPSSLSDFDSQQETPISLPIRATSTALQSRRVQLILPHNVTSASPISPLPTSLFVNTTNPSSVTSHLEHELDESLMLPKSTVSPSRSVCGEEKCSQNSTECHVNSSSESYRSTCANLDNTINLHESFVSCSSIEEFLTEPFLSESQIDRLFND